MDYGLNGQTVIVTGGASGVGRAISLKFADEGSHVTIFDLDEKGGNQAVSEMEAGGSKARLVKVDVTKASEVDAAVKQVIAEDGRIDVLVNNAGLVAYQGPWHLLPESDFEHVVNVNFKGQYLVGKAVANQMIKQKSGTIINTASIAALVGEPNNGVYSCTKAATINMTQSMAGELGQYGIRVNAVDPAAMPTGLMEKVYEERAEHFGLTPEAFREKVRRGFVLPGELTCEDAANVYLFLASNQSRMMTGEHINISGGVLMF
jgi:NAD(P)-dependent dehydrogenase (short-subunit alcohol dehydrogenase family)